ncbi:aminotransferase-like domain-containing protein [Erysipelatoclostridium sp. AM42-17]|uniref:aminotransferase-like domain-containing protein n=1 Tax=Erysipelatoclostridium sp. AM42-17 TaxID=2293102 RepID=UPI000E46F781|nr:PLP-dependent aminotransferase family protein [Erysipelatoclostridium sp. AM42-17]RHS93714.1 PLP-dependent aminotransferase family protein [Erysipelatoclostridium sp. AM42-17]
MNYQYSKRFNQFTPSMIRQVLVDAAGPDMINFSPGFPDRESFAVEEIQKLSQEVLNDSIYEILQYAPKPAYTGLQKAIKTFFNSLEPVVKESDDIMITSGSGEGLEMAAKVFLDEGDYMVVEDPSFIGALNGFKSNNAKLIGVPMDDEGLDLELLEQAFQRKPQPKLLYTIPTFQNPTCLTTTLERRKAIYELCKKYHVLILEDNPYGTLRFKGTSVPSYKSFDDARIVIYLASLSKIISPGIRLGAIVADKDITDHFAIMKGASGGAATNWSQYVITRFLNTVDMKQHIKRVSEIYQRKSTLMVETMKKTFHPDVQFKAPDGGMFVWFTLPDKIKPESFLQAAVAKHIAIVPGYCFATNYPSQGFRLSFTSESPEQIVKGITMLGELTYELMNQ